MLAALGAVPQIKLVAAFDSDVDIYDDDAAPLLPKGTLIHVSAWYDNTRANKNNPDPDQWVGYGDRTVDEMAHAWMNVVYLTDDEYKAQLAGRQKKTMRAANELRQ